MIFSSLVNETLGHHTSTKKKKNNGKHRADGSFIDLLLQKCHTERKSKKGK